MTVPGHGKYARREVERRFVLPVPPPGLTGPREIHDRYLSGTRLRLRVVHDLGLTTYKLGHKVRGTSDSPREVWHTSLYLEAAEAEVLRALPGTELTKTRWHWVDGPVAAGCTWIVDVHPGPPRLVIAELSSADPEPVSEWDSSSLGIHAREVTDDESFTGVGLAR